MNYVRNILYDICQLYLYFLLNHSEIFALNCSCMDLRLNYVNSWICNWNMTCVLLWTWNHWDKAKQSINYICLYNHSLSRNYAEHLNRISVINWYIGLFMKCSSDNHIQLYAYIFCYNVIKIPAAWIYGGTVRFETCEATR